MYNWDMNTKKLTNILLNNFLGVINKHKVKINECGVDPEDFRYLAQLMHCGVIDKKQFAEIIEQRIEEVKTEKLLA
jgi:Asp-tRNA(Asn)/Glu-tRNA(Gln) amidotransferase B subunit